MTWTARELEMAGAHPRLSYGEIARAYGVTRNQVAGLFYRMRHGETRTRPYRPQHWTRRTMDAPILTLLSDGRERTTSEIAERVGMTRPTAHSALLRLERTGSVCKAAHSRGDIPAMWVARRR